MTTLNELIASADNLCKTMEMAAANEKRFCDDICLELERYSWELYRMRNHLSELKGHYGEIYVRAQ